MLLILAILSGGFLYPSNKMPSRTTARVVQFHPLTYNWANRVRAVGGSIPTYKLSAIDQFIKCLVSIGLYSDNRASLIRYLLILSGSSSIQGCNVPLIDLDRVGNAILNNYVSADWSPAGLIGDAGTKFTNLRWIPFQNTISPDGHMLIWKTVKGDTNGAWGAQLNDLTDAWLCGLQGSTTYYGISDSTGISGASGLDTASCQILTRIGATQLFIRDRIIEKTDAMVYTSIPDLALWLHNVDTAPSANSYPANDRVWVVGVGNGLTAGQAYIYHDALALLKSRIGA
jgi:hypothetical protein